MMDWTSVCLDCGKVLESCPNGTFAEAAARLHLEKYPDHRCYVGVKVEKRKAVHQQAAKGR
jgi:hypothetical protein